MALKYQHMSHVLPILLSSVLVMSSVASTAAERYEPGEFLTLDLSKAVLSPKLLGPANTFGAVSAKARAHSDVVGPHAHAKAPHPLRTVQLRKEKPPGTARARLVHRHGNPLDAQAMDTRIQVWPCKSGAICRWKQ